MLGSSFSLTVTGFIILSKLAYNINDAFSNLLKFRKLMFESSFGNVPFCVINCYQNFLVVFQNLELMKHCKQY